MSFKIEKRVLVNSSLAHEFAMLVREVLLGDFPDNTMVEIANRRTGESFSGHVLKEGSKVKARLYSYDACIRKLDYDFSAGNGHGKYFVNDASYSNTTSKHQLAIRRAEDLLHSCFNRVPVYDVSDLDDIYALSDNDAQDFVQDYKVVLQRHMRSVKSKAKQKGSRLATVHKLASEAANIAYNGTTITGANEIAWLHDLFNNLQQVDNKQEIIATIDGFDALQG
jgi:hypothetical protein